MPFNSMVDQFLNPDEYKHIGGTYTEESKQPTVMTLNARAKGKILSMYKEGKNQSEIARALNIRPHVVRGYLYNYHPKLVRSKPFFGDDYNKAKAIELHNKGFSVTQISRVMGASYPTVKKFISSLPQ